MEPLKSLDPLPGPRARFAVAGNGRWRVDGRPCRMAAEIANDDDGNVVVTIVDPTTMEVVEVKRLDAA